jgi:hypothetical protein
MGLSRQLAPVLKTYLSEDGQEDWARELQAEIDALRTKRRKSRIG